MAIYLAPVNPEKDYPRIAELMNTASKACVTLAQLREESDNAQPGRIHLRIAAFDANGHMLGYGDVGRDTDMPTGRFWFDIVVDCAARRRGIGSMLYDDIAQFAREQGATSLEIAVRGDAGTGLRFAARRGFTVEHHERAQASGDAPEHAADQSRTDYDRADVYLFVRELA